MNLSEQYLKMSEASDLSGELLKALKSGEMKLSDLFNKTEIKWDDRDEFTKVVSQLQKDNKIKVDNKMVSLVEVESFNEASKDHVKLAKKAVKALQNAFDAIVDVKMQVMKEEEEAGRNPKGMVLGIEKDLQAIMAMRDSAEYNKI